jgi:hypothetical protein
MLLHSSIVHYTLLFSCAGDGSVYILSASLESAMALQRSVTLQPQLPLYSITLVDENRMFVGSRGGFVAGIHCKRFCRRFQEEPKIKPKPLKRRLLSCLRVIIFVFVLVSILLSLFLRDIGKKFKNCSPKTTHFCRDERG